MNDRAAQAGSPRLLIVVNDTDFFLSHRLHIALAAREAGCEVHIATPTAGNVAAIRDAGLTHHAIRLSRRGLHPLGELHTLIDLFRVMRELRPGVVHLVTAKPVLYGGLAARVAGVPAVVGAVSGLGFLYVSPRWWVSVVRWLSRCVYRLALRHPRLKLIFQNPDDEDNFLASGLARADQVVRIKGSGVDVNRFRATPEPGGAPVILLVARMLWDKGIGEFVEAARVVRLTHPGARFVLVGDSDPGNPSQVPIGTLRAWTDEGVVEWLGPRDDIPDLLAGCHIACLPSYREGLPKSLIEAAAAGRAMVSTDVPGCREIARHEETALLVPPRDAEALAKAIARLLDEPGLRARLGRRGRDVVVEEFSAAQVVAQHIAVYRELGGCADGGRART